MNNKSKEMDEQLTATGSSKNSDHLSVPNDNVGIVYVMVNQAMPGYVKIGKAKNIHKRIKTLSSNTSVPLPFTCYYAASVKNYDQVEKFLFDIFADKRVHSRREFFTVDPEQVAAAIKMVTIKDVTPTVQDKEIVDRADIMAINQATARSERREKFNFEMLDIPVGTKLQSTINPDAVCKVTSQKSPPKVEYEGIEISLSAAAKKIKNSPYDLQGPLYWVFEGETLHARRERIEGMESNDE